jgi:hypothetical protein
MTIMKKNDILMKEWQAILAKHSKPLERGFKSKSAPNAAAPALKEPTYTVTKAERINSRVTHGGSATVKPTTPYTGTAILGIATLHKSCMQPVFSKQEAIEVAQMRRN